MAHSPLNIHPKAAFERERLREQGKSAPPPEPVAVPPANSGKSDQTTPKEARQQEDSARAQLPSRGGGDRQRPPTGQRRDPNQRLGTAPETDRTNRR